MLGANPTPTITSTLLHPHVVLWGPPLRDRDKHSKPSEVVSGLGAMSPKKTSINLKYMYYPGPGTLRGSGVKNRKSNKVQFLPWKLPL